MWIAAARPDSRDAYAPCESEIGLIVAQSYEDGEALDTADSALRCTDLDPFLLASLRTPADEAAAEAALDTALSTPETAEVVDLDARRRRATPTGPQRGRQRAA